MPISLSDSSCRSHRVEDSYRRAFSIATAAWVGEKLRQLLVVLGEVPAAAFSVR